ncbi:MAG: hypothetical protein LBQ58_03965 [Synergistaceae bacterium]|jgi:hypothetical protein|nr:hypothetical protein [Synergistaceae bacterium]
MATEVAKMENKGTLKSKRERVLPQRPQRRYGIEVDRYEDVGTIIMQEGELPVRSLTDEESNSVPEEIRHTRKFTYPIGFPWDDVGYGVARGFKLKLTGLSDEKSEAKMSIYRKLNHSRACERMRQVLALGFPVRYCDADGGINYVYERHANGELYRVDFERNARGSIVSQNRVFLRMATEEDDALYDLRGTLGLTADDSAVF